MPDLITKLNVGSKYSRPTLAEIWGYHSYKAFGRGVFTPVNLGLIFLFVTKKKQTGNTQYRDFISDGRLYWEGETKHGNDQRIINAEGARDEIHLFYRDLHHTDFLYMGQIFLDWAIPKTEKPSEFCFTFSQNKSPASVLEEGPTDADILTNSRLRQQQFRVNQIRKWGRCAVTGCSELRLLVAAHVKPWRNSSPTEKTDPHNGILLSPTYDALFDLGFISFSNSGRILISDKLDTSDKNDLSVTEKKQLSQVPSRELKGYLEYHRDSVFGKISDANTLWDFSKRSDRFVI